MLSNKKHDTTSWDHVVQLQGSSHDIQEWQEKKQYEEQYIYIYVYIYSIYIYKDILLFFIDIHIYNYIHTLHYITLHDMTLHYIT